MKKPRPLTNALRRAQRRRHERDLAHRLKTKHHHRYLSDPVWTARVLAAIAREKDEQLAADAAQLPTFVNGGQE